MSEDLTPVEEQAIDAMLSETLGKSAAPDLSREILARLHDTQTDVTSIVRTTAKRKRRDIQPASRSNRFAVAATVIAAIAATFFLAIWLRPDRWMDSTTVAGSDSGEPELIPPPVIEPQSPVAVPNRALAEAPPSRKPPKGIPLVVDVPTGDDTDMPERETDSSPTAPGAPLEAASLVSHQLDTEMRSYWDAIGIQPLDDASSEEVVDRLSMLLGVTLPLDAVTDPERLRVELTQSDLSRAVAIRWLQQITERGLRRIDEQSRSDLVGELVACFQLDQRFDRVLADWINGTSPNAPAFYQAISASPRGRDDENARTRRLAVLTMNVDLRCTRCHDAYIEGNGRHQDYWSFAAFLRRGIKRDAEKQFTIDAESDSVQPLFYELADGRQRVAEPLVASSWIETESGQSIGSIAQWTEALIGSPELARGVVNSLWQLVHGQPLRGRVVDPISAPHNEALDRLEENLTRDLIQSRFDVARTLALVIASPATRRAVPTPLLAENRVSASAADTRAAMDAVDAFAAALPPRADLPMRDRLDETMRAIGAKLDTSNPAFVGQISEGSDNKETRQPDAKRLSSDFPSRADSLPVQWLTLISDEQSQIEHLAYLAGHDNVPQSVTAAVEAMREANVDRELMLHRVWWMLRP